MTDVPPAWRGGTRGSDAGLGAGAVHRREPELRAVVELVRGAAKGRGDIAHKGRARNGEVAAAQVRRQRSEGRGVSGAAASADEFGRFMPLGPMLMALGESSAAEAIDANRPGQADLAAWLNEFLRAQLEKRAAVSPLLVSLDDLH